MIILEESFKWHLEAFASELFIYIVMFIFRNILYLRCICYLWVAGNMEHQSFCPVSYSLAAQLQGLIFASWQSQSLW